MIRNHLWHGVRKLLFLPKRYIRGDKVIYAPLGSNFKFAGIVKRYYPPGSLDTVFDEPMYLVKCEFFYLHVAPDDLIGYNDLTEIEKAIHNLDEL